MASGSGSNTLTIWDVATGNPQATLNAAPYVSGAAALRGTNDAPQVYSVAWSPDGKQLAAGSGINVILVWDVASGELLGTLNGDFGVVSSVVWSPDGKQVGSGSDDGTIIVWDVANAKPQATLIGHTGPIKSVGWSPDGKQVASGSDDGTIIVWDVAGAKP